MTQNSQHQEAHGIGQIDEQLREQADAAESIQGINEADRDIARKARQRESEFDEMEF